MQRLPVALYDSGQIMALERIAGEEYGLSGFELMSRAGYQLFECIQRQYPNAKKLAVFCGGGNNAGDGYILASLALAAGWPVSVYSVGDPKQLKRDALAAYQSYLEAGGVVRLFRPELFIKADVFVDALLGTGLNRPVEGGYAAAIDFINEGKANVIAVDLPSGLNADTGCALGRAVRADCTLTLLGLKRGLFTGQAAEYRGKVFFASLAVPEQIYQKIPSTLCRLTRQALPKRSRIAHKGHFGHVLLIGGERGYSGAISLAAEAALRVGAGLVSVATRGSHAALLNIGRPELMCHGIDQTADLQPLLSKASVVVIGPGLGQSQWAEELFEAVVNCAKPLVADADALNILAKLAAAKPELKTQHWLLTPHVGEAGRLLNCPNEQINADRFAAVSLLQQRYGGVVVLKGAGTLITDGQITAVSDTGNPGMATGGMGDVLSGVIGGLLAQGLPPSQAAQQGVYMHGLAADLSAQEHGERGMLASDLFAYLRRVVNQ